MAAATPLPTPADPLQNILSVLGTLGTGTTTSTATKGASDQADAILKAIQSASSPEELNSLIQGIFLKAKTAFGPNIAASIAGGNRALSDTTLASLQSEAQAKATAESAQAILEARTNAN